MPRVFSAVPSLWELWGVQACTCSFSGGDAAGDRPIRCPATALGPAGRKQDNKPHRNPPPPVALTHGCLRSLGENTATDVQPLAMNWGSPILGISRTSNYKDCFPQVPHMSPECQRVTEGVSPPQTQGLSRGLPTSEAQDPQTGSRHGLLTCHVRPQIRSPFRHVSSHRWGLPTSNMLGPGGASPPQTYGAQ